MAMEPFNPLASLDVYSRVNIASNKASYALLPPSISECSPALNTLLLYKEDAAAAQEYYVSSGGDVAGTLLRNRYYQS